MASTTSKKSISSQRSSRDRPLSSFPEPFLFVPSNLLPTSSLSDSAPSLPSDPLPPSSFPESFPYDVFLSFRGTDTRNNFTGHLYDRLVMAGIHTFMDVPELHKGVEFPPELMKAIDESRTFVVVFSQNYASSTWCLNELLNIINKCSSRTDCLILPVFYGVQPSDVRFMWGRFGDAFRNHMVRYNDNDPSFVRRWGEVLYKASMYSGLDLQTSAFGSESRLISLIVKEVLSHVNPKKLFVAKYPVGLHSRVNDVHSLLRLEPNSPVQIIGISGMGGSGKSVIAKALYNKILKSFDSSCFLANVREVSQQLNGIVYLQEYLISELLMRETVKVGIVDRGKEIIRERLCRKKVLIVLDDATDKPSQVDALAGQRDWFGPGSIIIITTRDQHLLNQVQVDRRYRAMELNYEESLELFSWHSFNKRLPEESYAVTAYKIVSYCCGLPLALEALGAFLIGRTIQEWNKTFRDLQRNPLPKIQKILQISYDGLDYQNREIFLDIACFFTGMEIEYVTQILDGCGFSAEIGIRILMDRCLLTVNKNNELRMHDLHRNMGREIVRQPFPGEPGKHSRLWRHQDSSEVLKQSMGTEAIQGVILVSPIKEKIHLSAKNFERMHNLRLLQMDNVSFDGSFKELFTKIRWISWQDCSLKYLPSTLHTENLVALDMQHSMLKMAWKEENRAVLIARKISWMHRFSQGNHVMRHLKNLNLSHSKCLKSTANFRRVPNLVTLILEGCTSLVKIDPSIECLDSLLVFNLNGCKKITNIPSEICSLKSLNYLNVSGCSKLKRLPDGLGFIPCLREIFADETAITQLPRSLCDHNTLRILSLSGCTKISAGDMSWLKRLPYNLQSLNLRDCNLSDEDFPEEIYGTYQLRELDLAGNCLSKFPWSLWSLINLQSLWLDDWSILQSIPNLPPHLKALVEKSIC